MLKAKIAECTKHPLETNMFSGIRVYTTSDLSPNVLCNVIPNGRDQQGVTTDVML